jgi:hypothetical protein
MKEKENLPPLICNATLDEHNATSALGDVDDLPLLENTLDPTEEPSVEIRHTTEDWMLERHIFNVLEEQWGPFDVDACCDEEGRNSTIVGLLVTSSRLLASRLDPQERLLQPAILQTTRHTGAQPELLQGKSIYYFRHICTTLVANSVLVHPP